MKVVAIEEAGTADVYNMEVAETHDFAVNNGVIVHNCYDEQRYIFMENPIAARVNVKQKIDYNDPLDQRVKTKPKYIYV